MLFQSLKAEGVTQVVFCGVDEVAEIAYLSFREAGLELSLIMDVTADGRDFFGKPVVPIHHGLLAGNHKIVITSFKYRDALRDELIRRGAPLHTIYGTGISENPIITGEDLR